MQQDNKPIRTPLIRSEFPDGRVLWIKNEGAQPSGSFKIRGPSNFLALNDIPGGIVTTASSGNHAIGLSMAASSHGYQAKIMVPKTTPAQKLAAIENAGGEVNLVDGDYEAALVHATEYAATSDAVLVPSYDHADIIEGNRGVFEEIQQDIECAGYPIFVPIGGGGLFSGALLAFANHENVVHGVELHPYERVEKIVWGDALDLPPMKEPPSLSTEGVAIRTLGRIPADVIRKAHAPRLHSATVEELRNACKWLWQNHEIRAELGGCTALATALRETSEQNVICVISGSNIDLDLHERIVNDLDLI